SISSALELFSKFQNFVLATLETCHPHEKDNIVALIKILRTEFESRFLLQNNVHKVVATLEIPAERKVEIIKQFYAVIPVVNGNYPEVPVSLFAKNEKNPTIVFAVFGGQGVEDYFIELREIFEVYN